MNSLTEVPALRSLLERLHQAGVPRLRRGRGREHRLRDKRIDRGRLQRRVGGATASASASAAAAADLDGGQPAASASVPAGEVNGGNAAGQGAGGAAGLG